MNDHLSGQISFRVDGIAALADLEMQVRTCRCTGASHLTDPLAGLYLLSCLNINSPAVAVESGVSAAVIDDAVITVT